MTNEEHLELYGKSLPVHCVRGDEGGERRWRQIGVKPEECLTLCVFCYLAKHSIRPAVLRRDGFQCQECGMTPVDNRLWFRTITVHRLSGYCEEDIGPEADPAGFITLCLDCHEKKHPDKLAEWSGYGGQVILPKPIEEFGEKLGISLPITNKGQLASYKEYLLAVNAFITRFRKDGIPKKLQLKGRLLSLPQTKLSTFLRRKAAEEAVHELQKPRNYMFSKELKALSKMSKHEKEVYLQERKERALDYLVDRNASPSISVRIGDRTHSVRI